MRNAFVTSTILAALLGASFIAATSARAEGQIGNPTISVDDGAGGWKPYKPPVEKRKLAPKPIRHVTDKRSGWTYYLQQDRNGGGLFIQIEDANGSDVHINGEVPMPGGGPTYPVH